MGARVRIYTKAYIRTCAYQGVTNVIFSESFAYVLNEWPLSDWLAKQNEFY